MPARMHMTGAKTNIKRTITPCNKYLIGGIRQLIVEDSSK